MQELRYHGFFIGSSIFVLICDVLQDPSIIRVHQPWIHMGIQCLHLMREGEPIASTLNAIDLALKKLAQRQVYPDMRSGNSPEFSVGMSSKTGDNGTVSGNEGFDRSPRSVFLNGSSAPSLATEENSIFKNIGGSGPMELSDLQGRIDPSMVSLEGFFSWPLIEPFG